MLECPRHGSGRKFVMFLMPMQHSKCFRDLLAGYFVAGLIMAVSAGSPGGQTAPAPALSASTVPEPMNWTTQEDHKDMMDQLGITVLRPGPSGRTGATNAANYDPAKANPYPDLPDP